MSPSASIVIGVFPGNCNVAVAIRNVRFTSISLKSSLASPARL